MPANAPRNLAIGLTATAVLIVGLVIYLLLKQQTQAQIQTGEYVNIFHQAGSAAERVNALARLFDLGASDPDAPIVARVLFYGELDADQQQALFRDIGRNRQQPGDISSVVGRLTAALNTVPGRQTDADPQLMNAMIQALIGMQRPDDELLIKGLSYWKQGRQHASAAEYQQAITSYDEVIKLNGDIPAPRYDRALVFLALKDYPRALDDLNAVVQTANAMPSYSRRAALDNALVTRVRNARFIDGASIAAIVQALLRGDERLQLALQANQANYPALAEPARAILDDLAARQANQTAAAAPEAATPGSQATAQASSTPTQSAVAGSQSQIAFTSTRDGNSEIYAMNVDGTNQRRLTENAAGDAHPDWSPDGQWIAFETDRDGNDEIYVMNAEGGEVRNLSANPASDLQPAWSPDGSKIVFISDRDGNLELYLMNVDGTQPRRLTTNPGVDVTPVWSPDGRRVAFTAEQNSNREIAVIDADGSNLTILTNHPASDQQPTWSPDGKQIAFSSDRDGNSEIYVMDANGANQRNLTRHPANERFPAWSPDGRQIAFDTDRDGGALDFEIYITEADGTNQRNLSRSPGRDRFPAWSSAGADVATASTQDPLPPPILSSVPTPTPCAAPTAVFAKVWQDDPAIRQALGCPRGRAAIGPTVTQYYPRGTLYWAETQPQIYVLYGAETGTWQRLNIVGDIALQYDCPAGSFMPVRGFGNLLAAHPNVAEKIGRCGATAEEPEKPVGNGAFQRFEGGAILFIAATRSTGQGRVWVLFGDGTFKRVVVAGQ
jgi:Tol biopolymer transport system component/tetratricopeptide (TPR) repeat protein